MDQLFGQSNGAHESQPTLELDDGTWLRVVNARFVSERQFNWDLFAGYDQLRVLTYSSSVNAIRMLDKFALPLSARVRGHTAGDQEHPGTRRCWFAAIMGLKDDRHLHLERTGPFSRSPEGHRPR